MPACQRMLRLLCEARPQEVGVPHGERMHAELKRESEGAWRVAGQEAGGGAGLGAPAGAVRGALLRA
jgi:hypothetical protein